MSKKLMMSQWTEFQQAIAAMDDSSSPGDILNTILTWLNRYSEILSGEPFSAYSLDRFLSLQADDYPVELSPMRDVEFTHFRNVVQRYQARDAERIARYLRDTLEILVILSVDKQCQNCGVWELGVLKNIQDGCIAFECRQCGIARDVDGTRVSGKELTFALNSDLQDAGFI